MRTERIQLIFPPPWIMESPYPAPAVLIGSLRQRGFDPSFIDVNALVFHVTLDERFLKRVGYFDPSSKNVRRVLDYRQFMTSDAFYDFASYVSYQEALADFYEHLSREDGRNLFYPGLYLQRVFGDPPSARGIVDGETILDHALYQVLEQHCDREAGLFGITIAATPQLPYALKVAAWIKRELPRARICVGGPLVTAGFRNLLRIDDMKEVVDFMVVGAGEEALPLLGAGDSGHASICELADRRGFEPRGSTPVSEFIQPDYDLHDLGSYLLPETLLTVNFDKGCYWGRCKFCNYNAVFDHYFLQGGDSFVTQLARTARRYRTRHFHLAGAALPPAYGKRVSDRIGRELPGVSWFTCMRCEHPVATRQALRAMADAGCRVVAWGLESASQRVLDAMDKGIVAEEFERILDAAHRYGIGNTCMLIRGYPGEGVEDLETTLDFVRECHGLIDIAVLNEFQYNFGSKIPPRNGHRSERAGNPLLELMTAATPRGARESHRATEDEYVDRHFLQLFGQVLRNDVSLALCREEETPANFFHFYMYAAREEKAHAIR